MVEGSCECAGGQGDDAFDVWGDRDNGDTTLPAVGVNGGRRTQPLYETSVVAKSPAMDNHVQKTDILKVLASF